MGECGYILRFLILRYQIEIGVSCGNEIRISEVEKFIWALYFIMNGVPRMPAT
jgi:hypothetical protein